MTAAMKFSGITMPLPGGSFDVAELRKATSNLTAETANVSEKLGAAIEKAQAPVAVAYQDEPVKLFSNEPFCPDGHELKEVEGLDGIKRTMAVPVAGDADEIKADNKPPEKADPKGATELEMAARAAAPAAIEPTMPSASADQASAAPAAGSPAPDSGAASTGAAATSK